MANTVTQWDGKTGKSPLPAIGQFLPVVAAKVTISGTTTSEAITFPAFSSIRGVIVQVLDIGNNVATTDIDVTWSGNTVTLADGSTFNLDASGHTIYMVVWGEAKL